RGFGEHPNFFSDDLMRSNVRVQLFLPEASVEATVLAILEFAREEQATSGILAVENIERMVNLNNGEEVTFE
ncbi:MAG: hypothetical protein GTO40_23830, partial [Deltaproteobacteria bacterium]|nr:hypothetical protein [Deltaproteobacteria bacterium]